MTSVTGVGTPLVGWGEKGFYYAKVAIGPVNAPLGISVVFSDNSEVIGSSVGLVTTNASVSGNPLERIVGVKSLWPRPVGVLQKPAMGVLRPSGGANAVAGCWPTCRYRSDVDEH